MKDITISFLSDDRELTLPVTPAEFSWGQDQGINQLTLNGTGSINLPGEAKAHSDRLDCMFPAQKYPFCSPGAVTDPYYYIRIFESWISGKKIVRYVVSGAVNAQVLIEEIQYKERDGTGDVYATVYLKEYKPLESVTTQAIKPDTGNLSRPSAESGSGLQYYTVKKDDCLSVICRRFYGRGSSVYYNALAKYNGIKNPHLIHPGQELIIPPAAQLGL